MTGAWKFILSVILALAGCGLVLVRSGAAGANSDALHLTLTGLTNGVGHFVVHPPDGEPAAHGYDLYKTTNLSREAPGLNLDNWRWLLRTKPGQTNLAVDGLTAQQGWFLLSTASLSEKVPIRGMTTYVGPDGDDATAGRGYGTFVTLSQAVGVLENGDRLVMLPGDTEAPGNGTGWPLVSWRNLTNVTVNGMPGSRIVATSHGNLLGFSNCFNLAFEGVTVVGLKSPGNSNTNLYSTYTSLIASEGPSEWVTFRHCVFSNAMNQAIAHISALNTVQSVRHLRVEYCRFYQIGNVFSTYNWNGPDGSCVAGLMAEGCVVRHNYVENSTSFFEFGYGGDLSLPAPVHISHMEVSDNVISNCVSWGIVLGNPFGSNGLQRATIARNRIYGVPEQQINGGGPPAILSAALHTDVLDNYVADWPVAFGLRGGDSVRVANNTFERCGSLLLLSNPSLQVAEVVNNRFIHCSGSWFPIGGQWRRLIASGARETHVLRNTFIETNTTDSYIWVALFNGSNNEQWPYYTFPGEASNAVVLGNRLMGEANSNPASYFCASLGSFSTVVHYFDNQLPPGFVNRIGGRFQTADDTQP